MEQPKIPTLRDSQKPQVKVRGLEASATIFDRLKQFKKKDLAFILAGLGTLFMAPLAEHFMMSPESGDATLNQGFGKGGASTPGGFGGGTSPYEPGTSGMAPGSAVGGGSDIITPLNVRDPSALVMGPAAAQQPPTNSVAPGTPPPSAPSRSDADLKDALAASARGVGAAAKKALLPVPKLAIAGSGLRGLGVSSGGSSASAGLAAPNSNGLVSGKANAGGGLTNVRAMPNYKGVASRGPGTGGSGIEALKKAAENAGERMNQGAATSALNDAANAGIPTSGIAAGGNGAGGMSGSDKWGGGNQDKNSKSVGESLDFLKRKQEQEKQIELDWKKKEANDWSLQYAGWRNDFMKSMVSDGLAKPISGLMGSGISGLAEKAKSASDYQCTDGDIKGIRIASSKLVSSDKCADGSFVRYDQTIYRCLGKSPSSNPVGLGCYALPPSKDGKGGDTDSETGGAKENGQTLALNGQSVTPQAKKAFEHLNLPANDFPALCRAIDDYRNPKDDKKKILAPSAIVKKYLDSLQKAARQAVTARDALYQGPTNDCQTEGVDALATSGDGTVLAKMNGAVADLGSGAEGDSGAIAALKAAAFVDNDHKVDGDLPGLAKYRSAAGKWKEGKKSMEAISKRLHGEFDRTIEKAAMPDKIPGGLREGLNDLKAAVVSSRDSVAAQEASIKTASDNLGIVLNDDLSPVVGENADKSSVGDHVLKDVVEANAKYIQLVELKTRAATGSVAEPNKTITPGSGSAAGTILKMRMSLGIPAEDKTHYVYQIPATPDVPPSSGHKDGTVAAVKTTADSLEMVKAKMGEVDKAIKESVKGTKEASSLSEAAAQGDAKNQKLRADFDKLSPELGAALDKATVARNTMDKTQANWLDNIKQRLDVVKSNLPNSGAPAGVAKQ